MAKIGYARVSSTGQSLDVQISKLKQVGCDKIYSEKRSGKTSARTEYNECMSYLREGDELYITRLDRLARSVIHLSQIAERFNNESIHLIVIDQSIDTSTSTGRLMFNMLAAIAEFETDLRSERQQEGIQKARENGTIFGRKPKRNDKLDLEIYKKRTENGDSVGSLAKEYKLGEATIYRIVNDVKAAQSKE